MNQRTGLFRSRTDKVIGGVAGGIAKSLNTDPSIIRLIFVLLAVFGGGGVLLYLILWIVLPEDYYIYTPSQEASADHPVAEESTAAQAESPEPQPYPVRTAGNGSLIAGLILIIIGGFFLIARYIPRFDLWHFWPIVLVFAGLVIIIAGFSRTKK